MVKFIFISLPSKCNKVLDRSRRCYTTKWVATNSLLFHGRDLSHGQGHSNDILLSPPCLGAQADRKPLLFASAFGNGVETQLGACSPASTRRPNPPASRGKSGIDQYPCLLHSTGLTLNGEQLNSRSLLSIFITGDNELDNES